ncbi:DUF3137 domain-containing protein [Crocinitomicaceae bacterium]|nr:DUF3137 domain-containing protein [Crocinitomicaceae bacterium]
MKTAEEFNRYYDDNLISKLRDLENERKKLLRPMIFLCLPFVGSVVIFFLNFFVLHFHHLDRAIFVGAILINGTLGAVFLPRFFKLKKALKVKYKEEIIKEMVYFIDPSLSYNSTSFISQSDFENSKLFIKGIDRYEGDDLVVGNIGKTEVRFSELNALYENNDNDSTKYVSLFKGIFFIADFHKDFAGETIVLPDTAEKLFGKLGAMFQKMNVSRPDLVKLENPDFEKAFVVYGTDQVETRYILTPALIQRIMDFQKKSGKIYLSFLYSKVYIAISLNKNLFEPPLFKSMLNYKIVEDYFKYLMLMVNIVEDLDLNTRIWSKN